MQPSPLPIPANDNVHPDEPLRLEEAIKFAFPHGGMTASGLRNEARAGRLVIEKIANKHFTTLRAIEEMRKSCRVKNSQPAFGSVRRATIETRSGSSSIMESKLALAAARMAVTELKNSSKNI
jgi:hypothetical protein